MELSARDCVSMSEVSVTVCVPLPQWGRTLDSIWLLRGSALAEITHHCNLKVWEVQIFAQFVPFPYLLGTGQGTGTFTFPAASSGESIVILRTGLSS